MPVSTVITFRAPDFATIPFNQDQINTRNALNWRFVSVYVNRFQPNSVAFQAEAGVSEAVNTWAGWKALGREVIHGSKALFGVSLIWGSKGDGAEYKASFFGLSQVQATA